MNRTLTVVPDPYEKDMEQIASWQMQRWLPDAQDALGPARYNGAGAHRGGEWSFCCPVHAKDKPASNGLVFSVKRGDPFQPHWWCRFCCGVAGMEPMEFMERLARYLPSTVLPWEVADLAGVAASKAPVLGIRREAPRLPSRQEEPLPGEDQIAAWSRVLLSQNTERSPLNWLVKERMWSRKAIQKLQIGWHYGRDSFAIPVRDSEGQLANVRLWDRRKLKAERWRWLVPGVENPRLWPLPGLVAAPAGGRVYLCAGEPDTMAALSLGYAAVTSLLGEGQGGRLQLEDLRLFAGKRVVVLFDSDPTGRAGARAAVKGLKEHGECASVLSRDLFPSKADGSDLTTWLLAGNSMPMPPARNRRAR